MGLSPLETLRQLLAEDAAQTAYRQSYWKNSSRIEGVITRPKDAPKWNLDQKQAFREQWQTRYGGGSGAGATAVLEDGMQFQPVSFSARDSEFVPARKLTREEVAAAYHVPLPMVGILDHATFSNIKEQHKQLYQDCLGPWLQMIAEEIERQLLPDSEDSDRVYLEFNIQEKLKGSFEEQAASLYALVGRPIMTANEGRARLNLPRITDDASADALALPLNTSSGAITLPEPVAAERLLMLEAIIDGVEVEAA
jgi:HK97 family phage portal protein